MAKGILYACTGIRLLEEAIASAKSVRKYNQSIKIAIYTDIANIAKNSAVFDIVYEITNPTYSNQDKIWPLYESPFEETLFLDSDTRVLANIDEMFLLLLKFDIALAHAPIRVGPISYADTSEIPAIFPEFNTGVILYRKNDKTKKLFKSWETILQSSLNRDRPKLPDQPAFRQSIWNADSVRLYVLTPEYNLRTLMPYFVGGGVKAVILHDRKPRISLVGKSVNKSLKPRTGGNTWWLRFMFILEKFFYKN